MAIRTPCYQKGWCLAARRHLQRGWREQRVHSIIRPRVAVRWRGERAQEAVLHRGLQHASRKARGGGGRGALQRRQRDLCWMRAGVMKLEVQWNRG